jgi:hypothetical protein
LYLARLFLQAQVDYTNPESQKLSVLAPPGNYKALNLTLGVPNNCPGGEQLNHGDASARVAPLDVDSDMYWTWNPNYTFLKIEGQALVEGASKPFFFHVGEDARRAELHLHVQLNVSEGQPSHERRHIVEARLRRDGSAAGCSKGAPKPSRALHGVPPSVPGRVWWWWWGSAATPASAPAVSPAGSCVGGE